MASIWSRINGGILRLVIGIAVFAFVCSVPFWWGSWWVHDEVASSSNDTIYAQPAIATPESIGYNTVDDAVAGDCPPERVMELWRGGRVVGYGCNRD